MAGSVDGVDTVESEGFLVIGCLAVRQRISEAQRLPFSPRRYPTQTHGRRCRYVS